MSFFTKDMIGESVILLPTGNLIRTSLKVKDPFYQAKEAVIEDISPRTVTLVNHHTKFTFKEEPYPQINNNSNGGYRVFTSWEEFHAHRIAQSVREKLMDATVHRSSENQITNEQYKQIAQILGWHDILQDDFWQVM